MRILMLLRGAPGCGKSTWIRALRAVTPPEEIPTDICTFLKKEGPHEQQG